MTTLSASKYGASEYTHTINGHAQTSSRYFAVMNPATASPFAFAPDASQDQLDQAVTSAQFAPVLPVLKYLDVEDALRRANSTRFGLGSSVWTRDIDRAALIEAGTVWINSHANYEADIPFGGFKESGVGREMGRLGFLSFLEAQIIHWRSK